MFQKLLGHSDIKTTEICAHLSPQTFHGVVRLLDGVEMRLKTLQTSYEINKRQPIKFLSGVKEYFLLYFIRNLQFNGAKSFYDESSSSKL